MQSKNNPDKDAQALRAAMKGTGTDEDAIIAITGNRSNFERQQIRASYKAEFGRDILEDLEDELNGQFKNVVVGMYLSPVEYDVEEIFKSVDGAGTNVRVNLITEHSIQEDTLTEILGSRSNSRLEEIKKLYETKYKESLEKRIKSECSGDYRNLLISILQCKRDESNSAHSVMVNQDVANLYNAGEGKCKIKLFLIKLKGGTDEEVFNTIFALRSSAHLAAVNQTYLANYHKNLLDIVESEFSGDIKVLLKTILHSHINPIDYFAGRIYKACKGFGKFFK